MDTTIYDGVKTDPKAELLDIEHRLAVAFNVTPDELNDRMHRAGLFLISGDAYRPWAVGIRRILPDIMEGLRQKGVFGSETPQHLVEKLNPRSTG